MMKQLQIKFHELTEKLHQLSYRERIIITGAVMVVMLGVFDQLVFSKNLAAREKLSKDKTHLQDSMSKSIERIDELEAVIKNDPNRVLKEKIAALKDSHMELDGEIAEITDGMIAPEKMPFVLGELLSEKTGLKVVSIKSDAGKRLIVADENQAESAALYRHDLEIRLRGSFFQMMDYLSAIESLPSKLLWDDLEYVVDRYPKGSLVLRVHTLSAQEALIRVSR